MEKEYIIDFEDGKKITTFFMIKQAQVKIATNSKKYMDFTLMDKTGEINAKLWELPKEADDYTEGTIVKIAGQINDYRGSLQLKVNKIRVLLEEDDVIIQDYIKAAPIDAEIMYGFLMGKIDEMQDEEIKELTKTIYTDYKEQLLYFPAAMKNHHAIMGGLLYHVKRMLEMAEKMTEVYPVIRKDHLYSLYDMA